MNLLPFVRRLFSALSTKRKKCQRRLGVEPLEDRTLLAAFEVVTAGDTPAGSCTGAACTLRDAVNAANATAGADEISFNGSFGDANPGDENYSITLASELAVTESLTINGFASAAVSISGNDATRLFNFEGGGANTYVLNNLTLAQGNSAGARTGFGGAVVMVDADDTLTINDSVIRDSAATSGGGTSGGGIYVQAGTFNLNRSAVINNSASFGGGLEFRNATATLTNVTVSGNQASSNLGGGISHGANGTGATSQLTIRNSTIAGNSSPGGANLDNTTEGGATSSVVTYQNTIFAQPLGGGVNVRNLDIAGTGATATSLGDNISDDTTGNLIAAGDLPNTNALLGPLANNGSNLPTHAPLTGSPAINAGRTCPELA